VGITNFELTGDIGILAFYPNKQITTGEGGAFGFLANSVSILVSSGLVVAAPADMYYSKR